MFFHCDKFLNSRLCIFKKVFLFFILSVFTFSSYGNGGKTCAAEFSRGGSLREGIRNVGSELFYKVFFTGVGRGISGFFIKKYADFVGLEELANQGSPVAQREIALMYRYGLGVKQDFEKAVDLFEQSARQGDAKAQYHLGAIYRLGEGISRDYVQAYKWALLSSDRVPYTDPSRLLRLLNSEMTEDQIAEAQKLADEFQIQQ